MQVDMQELREVIRTSSLKKGFVKDVKNNCEIKSIHFGIMSKEEIIKYSEVKIMNREMYKSNSGIPYPYGVLDLKLGAHKSNSVCETCNRKFINCSGHFGHIELNYPFFHIGYYKYIIHILYCICKTCSNLLLPLDKIEIFSELKRKKTDDSLFKKHLFKRILNECKKINRCYKCGSPQGVIKKIIKPSLDQFMKLKHILKVKVNGKMIIKEEDLNSLYVLKLFRNINPFHVKLLNIEKPEKLIITALLVPPNTIRPSVIIDEHGTAEDDLTCILSEIAQLNNTIHNQCLNGYQTNQFLGNIEFLQLQLTRFINSDSPAVSQLLATQNISKPGRGICQRLKGKEGRFRCNLSGKRVDFSSRTVISPDPNISIDEVVIPKIIAMRLTYPEIVNKYNMEKLKMLIRNGANMWPGANYIIKRKQKSADYVENTSFGLRAMSNGGMAGSGSTPAILDALKRYINRSGIVNGSAGTNDNACPSISASKISLKYANKRYVIDNLSIGDIVERHICNGDIVLFNRQPSLHRMSIMCHKAKVMDYKTFRFNECVCSPYNADFDGDEMNLHVPQTEEARAEALYLMNVKHNLITPKNGEVIIALTQDFLSASYIITNKDTFIDRDTFCLLCCYFSDGKVHIELPVPAILKPKELWTGKQLISVLIKPNRKENTIINFELKEREYSSKNGDLKYLCLNDSYVCFYKSELVCGSLGKKVLGSSKYGLFYYLIHHNSSHVAVKIMNRFSKLTSRYFSNKGMTIGIDDVTPSTTLTEKKKDLLLKGYDMVNKEIISYNEKKMQIQPGCTLQETLEIKVKNILDDLRNDAGKTCNQYLHHLNKPLIMFNSGAKGALINIAQMIACVGQQNVAGQRIQNGFINRTLPHFHFHCKDSESRGFVQNSFYTGLNPTEFFFHTMSGREGLVDTAVKTAETGYMQRRLMKALEDLSIHYDYSVRSCDKQIIQFIYGDDALNPSFVDNNNTYADQFDKIFHHIISISSSHKLLSFKGSLHSAQMIGQGKMGIISIPYQTPKQTQQIEGENQAALESPNSSRCSGSSSGSSSSSCCCSRSTSGAPPTCRIVGADRGGGNQVENTSDNQPDECAPFSFILREIMKRLSLKIIGQSDTIIPLQHDKYMTKKIMDEYDRREQCDKCALREGEEHEEDKEEVKVPQKEGNYDEFMSVHPTSTKINDKVGTESSGEDKEGEKKSLLRGAQGEKKSKIKQNKMNVLDSPSNKTSLDHLLGDQTNCRGLRKDSSSKFQLKQNEADFFPFLESKNTDEEMESEDENNGRIDKIKRYEDLKCSCYLHRSEKENKWYNMNSILPPRRYEHIGFFVNEYRNIIEIKKLVDQKKLILTDYEKRYIDSKYNKMSKNIRRKIEIVNNIYKSEKEKIDIIKEKLNDGNYYCSSSLSSSSSSLDESDFLKKLIKMNAKENKEGLDNDLSFDDTTNENCNDGYSAPPIKCKKESSHGRSDGSGSRSGSSCSSSGRQNYVSLDPPVGIIHTRNSHLDEGCKESKHSLGGNTFLDCNHLRRRRNNNSNNHCYKDIVKDVSENEILYENKYYKQMIKNIIAFVSVFEHVENLKQHFILFPYEIVKWTEFLINYLTEIVPSNIFIHTHISKEEKPTHQKNTRNMKIYIEEIKKWLFVKAINIYKYLKYKKGFALIRFKDYYDFLNNTYDISYRYMIYDYSFINLKQLYLFVFFNIYKYFKYISAPGDAVGSISAQSIGEPGTQMTLKTFHFAGVASMNVTLGVPRIKEIINASSIIQTPILNIPLEVKDNYNFALMIKSKLEKTTIRDVCEYIKEDYTSRGIFLCIKFNKELMQKLFLNITSYNIRDIILKQSHINKIKINKICIEAVNKFKLHISLKNDDFLFFQLESLKRGLLDLLIYGNKDIKRCIIKKEEVEVTDSEVASSTGSDAERNKWNDANKNNDTHNKAIDDNMKRDRCTAGMEENDVSTYIKKEPGLELKSGSDAHDKQIDRKGDIENAQNAKEMVKLENIMENFSTKIMQSNIKREMQKQKKKKKEKKDNKVNLDSINIDSLNFDEIEINDIRNDKIELYDEDSDKHIEICADENGGVLGIEAARVTIINEIKKCVEAYSIDIDIRHIMLLADIMAFTGDILGINRFGIQKARQSTLMLASFEETNEHLFVSSFFKNIDEINNISESIIVGKNIPIGTGSFQLLYNYKLLVSYKCSVVSTNKERKNLTLLERAARETR
ncbi:DNA-directed RNA polymerase III subunit RPC1, putative [Plasmodium malariae]|uniref:DNA-directed RNA polymerase subunit n=1 Tax=Plasmodium malariae TaxID=5858 RepID=A0A1D3SQK4_PLAMA|nr:DNA-directed RNA polymerase III subunit RPC1, putative [Plasmodium malariae]SCO93759.1 DNA-directed RNA polymerase III subunit RPC1, putative [Plasmodium malariae]